MANILFLDGHCGSRKNWKNRYVKGDYGRETISLKNATEPFDEN